MSMNGDELDSLLDPESVLEQYDDEGGALQDEGMNRQFMIMVGGLAALFIIGLCLIIYLVVIRPNQDTGDEVSDTVRTNEANQQLATEQAIQTQTQAAMEETTDEGDGVTEVADGGDDTSATATPTSSIVTSTEGAGEGDGSATAEGGDTGTGEDGDGGESGIGEGTPTPTDLVPAGTDDDADSTQSVIEVTIPGGDVPTPTPLVGSGGDGGDTDGDGTEPTGVGGVITPTDGELPETGLLDNGTSLAGLGILAAALVTVVFVVRRIRLK